MTNRTAVSIEEVVALRNRLSEINELDPTTIDWYANGKKVEVKEEDIEEWRFTGLGNVYFAEMELADLVHPVKGRLVWEP